MRGNSKPIKDISCQAVWLYRNISSLWLSSCLFQPKLQWHTHKTAADNKALKSFLLWSQSWGKSNIVWDVWYYHGNPICVQSQQDHLFSIKKAKWHEEEFGRDQETVFFVCILYVLYMWTCSSVTYNHNMCFSAIHWNSSCSLTALNNKTEYWSFQTWINYYPHSVCCTVSLGQFTLITQQTKSVIFLPMCCHSHNPLFHASVRNERMNGGWCLDSPWWRLW